MKIPPHITHIIGVDEVGRGALAGPVTVGAMMYARTHAREIKRLCRNIQDSKKLSARMREQWSGSLKSFAKQHPHKLQIVCSSVSAKKIDEKGISWALRQAVSEALRKLQCDTQKNLILLDGSLYAPEKYEFQKTIIRGDEKEFVIAGASIIAKVYRDAKMIQYTKKFPKYNWGSNKGYGTRCHRKDIKQYGTTPLHRVKWTKN